MVIHHSYTESHLRYGLSHSVTCHLAQVYVLRFNVRFLAAGSRGFKVSGFFAHLPFRPWLIRPFKWRNTNSDLWLGRGWQHPSPLLSESMLKQVKILHKCAIFA